MKTIKALDLILTLTILLTASMAIHEYGHLATLRILGGRGTIDSGILNGVTLNKPCPWPHGNTITAFAGGWTSALTFLLLWALSEDPETKTAKLSIATYQATYGTFEGAWYITKTPNLLVAGTILGIVALFIVMLTGLLKRGVEIKE